MKTQTGDALTAHPVADTYPMMTAPEMEALVADIAERGLQRPIVLYQGQILDGRNRLAACRKAGVEPVFVEYEGDDPAGQANSLNLNRDLTGAQRAMIAARQWLLAGDTKRRGRQGKEEMIQSVSISQRTLVQKFRVSAASLSQARDLLLEAPDLAEQVIACALPLAQARALLDDRREEAAQKEKDARLIAKYAEAVSNGEMTFDQAMQKVMEEEREEKQRRDAEADGRGRWLRGTCSAVEWVESHVAKSNDAYFEWNLRPGALGWFQHGLTPARLDAAAADLVRLADFIRGTSNGTQQGR